MVARLYETAFTVPAGTPIAAPFTQVVVLEDENLDTVRIVVPDGHAGLTGVAIQWSGVNIAPFGIGTWIVANAEVIDFPYDGEVAQNGLNLAGYNLDVFPHTFYLRWQISDLVTSTPVVIDSAQNQAAPTPDMLATVQNLAQAVTLPGLADTTTDDTSAIDTAGALAGGP